MADFKLAQGKKMEKLSDVNDYRKQVVHDKASEESETFESFFYHLLWKPIFFHHLLSGSFFELPMYYVLANLTDTDRMRIHSNIHAIPLIASPADDTGIQILIIDTQESPVGFCRLRMKQPNENAFYSRDRYGLHGPANKMFLSKWLDVGYKLIEKTAGLLQFTQMTLDEVDAIFCPYWPAEAEEWFTRTSVSGWPDKNLKDHILRRGCHLVAKSHHSEPDDSTQWRYSFSQAEVILINSWNDVQKYIYHILRVIKKCISMKCKTPEKSVFNNYFFKTLMLWASEKKRVEFWNEECIESSIAELLCQAIECLIDRECQHYFIPKVNILDHSLELDTTKEISSLAEHIQVHELQSIMSLFLKYDDKIMFKLTVSKKFIVHYKLQLVSTFIINPFSSTCDRYFDTDVENDALVRKELETLFKGLLTALQLRHSKCMAKRIDLEQTAIECFRSCIEDDCDDQFGGIFSYGESFYKSCERFINDNRYTTQVLSETGSACSKCVQSDSLNQVGDRDNVKENMSESKQSAIPGEIMSNCSANTLSQKNSSSEDDKRVDDYQRAPLDLKKPLVGERHTVLSSVLELFGSLLSDLYKKPCYLVSRAYCANFYFTSLKDYRTALELCKETLECIESVNNFSEFDTRFSEDVFPIIWSSYWMPLFDESIQLVFGFLMLTINIQYDSGAPMSSCYWVPPSSLKTQISNSQMLDSVIKPSSPRSQTLPKKRKFQQTKLLSSVIVQVSGVEFLRYIGVQSRKQLGLGNDRLFDMRKRHPSLRRLLMQSLLLVAADSINRHHPSS